MKEKTNVFKKFFKCLYDVTAFPKYARQGTLSAILYIVTLAVILGVIKGVFIGYKSNSLINEVLNIIENKDYKFHIDDEKLNIQGSPIIVENNDNIIIYVNDEKGLSQESEFNSITESKDISALVLEDGIILKRFDSEYVFKYTEIFDTSRVENEVVVQKLKSLSFNYKVITLIEIILITLIDLFLNLLIVAILGGIISMLMRMVIKYKALFAITIYASTLPLIIFSILQMFYMSINFDLVFIMGTLTYLIITLFNVRREIIEKIKSGKI